MENLRCDENNAILKLPTMLVGIFAHEDDEILGPGGLLAKNVKKGGVSHLISFGGKDKKRLLELKKGCDKLNITFETLALTPISDDNPIKEAHVVSVLKDRIIELKPEFVVTHRKEGDYHPEHRMVSFLSREAVIRAQFPVKNHIAKGLLYTEGHSLHSNVHVFVDITEEYDLVVEAAKLHMGQMVKNDNYYLGTFNARSLLRGVQAGCERAEAFVFEPLPLIGSMNRRNLGV